MASDATKKCDERVAGRFRRCRFAAWLAEKTGEHADLEVTAIRGGGSCEMFRVDRLGESWVVRRAPRTAVSDTAHQVVREARIMESLAARRFRYLECWRGAKTPAILGCPVFRDVLCRWRRNPPKRVARPPLRDDPGSQSLIGEQLIDTLVDLHAVDWTKTVLAEISRPAGFLDRQVDRWTTQLDSYRLRDLADVDEIARWLQTNMPEHGELTVMHGDYKVDNLIWAPAPPPPRSPASSTLK